MSTLDRRIEALENVAPDAAMRVTVVHLVPPAVQVVPEVRSAWAGLGQQYERREGEGEAQFLARARAAAPGSVLLAV